MVNSTSSIDTIAEIDQAVAQLTEVTLDAKATAVPQMAKKYSNNCISFNTRIAIKSKNAVRRRWQRSQNPDTKAELKLY